MSSVKKHPRSKYWFACYVMPDGRRVQRSTKTTDRRKALRIAMELESFSEGVKTETQARKMIADIYRIAHNGEQLPGATVGEYLNAWIKQKQLEITDATYERYSGVIEVFRSFLGDREKIDILQISRRDISAFRDSLSTRKSTGTVNLCLKVIKAVFEDAKRDGLVSINEAANIKTVADKDRVERRAFSIAELKTIMDHADGEWRGMILLGIYTGQRLADIACLSWKNIDLERGEIRFITRKTGRPQGLPIAKPLRRFLDEIPQVANSSSDIPLFPEIQALYNRGGASPLSNQFYQILVNAGMAQPRTHQSSGVGRQGRRNKSGLSFHCLRHTATSLLKNAGVSEAVAMEFIGHESKSISQNYSHIDLQTLNQAADKLPDILRPRDQANVSVFHDNQ